MGFQGRLRSGKIQGEQRSVFRGRATQLQRPIFGQLFRNPAPLERCYPCCRCSGTAAMSLKPRGCIGHVQRRISSWSDSWSFDQSWYQTFGITWDHLGSLGMTLGSLGTPGTPFGSALTEPSVTYSVDESSFYVLSLIHI